ncbi:hypothetical protein [Bradyrhizobium sp. LCT2]|nr:hypothetical protein [Bradyrhizobium sp. LCT2]
MVDEIVALKAESGRNLIDFGGAGFASALGQMTSSTNINST